MRAVGSLQTTLTPASTFLPSVSLHYYCNIVYIYYVVTHVRARLLRSSELVY